MRDRLDIAKRMNAARSAMADSDMPMAPFSDLGTAAMALPDIMDLDDVAPEQSPKKKDDAEKAEAEPAKKRGKGTKEPWFNKDDKVTSAIRLHETFIGNLKRDLMEALANATAARTSASNHAESCKRELDCLHPRELALMFVLWMPGAAAAGEPISPSKATSGLAESQVATLATEASQNIVKFSMPRVDVPLQERGPVRRCEINSLPQGSREFVTTSQINSQHSLAKIVSRGPPLLF